MTAAAKTTKAVAVAVVVAVFVRHTIVRSIRRCPTVIANVNAPAGPDACTETLTAVGCLSPLAVIPVRSPPPTLHLPLLHVSTQRLRHVQPLPPISTASAARLINRRNARSIVAAAARINDSALTVVHAPRSLCRPRVTVTFRRNPSSHRGKSQKRSEEMTVAGFCVTRSVTTKPPWQKYRR